MILPHHPDLPKQPERAIGYWRVPLNPERLAESEAIIAGNGTARTSWGGTVSASVEGTRQLIASMHAEDKQPDPRDFVDPSWDVAERDRVIAYLTAGYRLCGWMGLSTCRFCGCRNGSTCLSDGFFVWPEGFPHYLAAHAVRPPVEFVQHVLAGRWTKP